MKENKTISFFTGLLLTSLIFVIQLIVYLGLYFSFAGQTIEQKETQDAVIFFSALFTILVTTFFVLRFLKRKRYHLAAGVFLPLILGIWFLFVNATTYFNDIFYTSTYNKEVWLKAKSKPFKMAITLHKEKSLVGLTKQEIIERLGPPAYYIDQKTQNQPVYVTNFNGWELIIIVKKGVVIDTIIYQHGLEM